MRHYEIVYLVHPDQDKELQPLIDRYKKMVTASGGKVHRLENWGRRQLAYPINKLLKAHYVLMNIECAKEILAEIENDFRFNDAIIRHLTLLRKEARTEPSAVMKGAPSGGSRSPSTDRRGGGYDRSPSSTSSRDDRPASTAADTADQAADAEEKSE